MGQPFSGRGAAICTALAAVLVLCTGHAVWAQATAGISGTARDESGGVLPGVTVTATQTETGLTRTTVSTESGSYSLPNLPLGPYRLEASLQGFRTYTQTGIVLQVGSAPVVNATLGLGTVAENVEVTATAPLVDTRTAGVATVVESERIVELPLNARQVTQLITLSGFAVQTGSSPGYSMNTGVRVSVAGSSDAGVSYSLDGAPHINAFDGTGLHLPFPDALQEFRIVTSAQEAGGSIRSGAAVNGVTKAGTNRFHGNAFEFLRDSRFNAPDFFSNRKDGLKRNQFGGTLGGPLVRDRLFFFAGYQGTTTRQFPGDTLAFVPTAAMLAGDFSTFASPACNSGRQINLGAPFVNNRINPASFSPAALNISRRMPQPIDECGRVFWGSPLHQDEHQLATRVDYQASGDQSYFGRYMLVTDDRKEPFEMSGGNPLVTAAPGYDDRAHYATFGHTWVINSTMVNSFRVLGNDVYAKRAGANFFNPRDVGIDAFTYVPGYFRLIIPGGFNLGNGAFSSNINTRTQTWGLSNDFTLVSGSHQFGFGGHYLRGKTEFLGNVWAVGSYTFTGQFTGHAMADFFLGRIGQHRQSAELPLNMSQPFVGLYAQDTWKLNRVTLNYGVVWNPFFPFDFFDGQGFAFDRDLFLQGARSTVIRNAPPGFFYTGDPQFEGKSGVKRRLNEWEPRVGIAWDVNGDGRTAVRAGFGMAHDYPAQNMHSGTAAAAPFRPTITLPPGVSLDTPWASYPGGNPFPFTFNPNNPVYPPYSAFLAIPLDQEPTIQYSWNAGVQRQIVSNLFAGATYVGSKMDHLVVGVEANPALYIPGNCVAGQYGLTAPGPCSTAANRDFRRALNLANPSAQLGYITQYGDTAYRHYHGLLLNSRLDVGSYLNFNANYTLSKCEGVQSTNLLNVGGNHLHQPYQNNGPQDIALDEGPCNEDRRHIFNLTSVFRTPRFSGVLGALASDWTASSVLQMRSGTPVNVTTGLDNALNGFIDNAATQRPNLVPGIDPFANTGALVGYYNSAAFTQPATGTLGDTPYNYLRGPRFWQWDQAFTRAFQLGSGQRIEIRAEAINIVNHMNRGNPGAVINNANTFGRITTLAAGTTPRVWQFAVKYNF